MAKARTRTRTMKGLKCPECGEIFYRPVDLAGTVLRCPACATLLTFDRKRYAKEDPKYVRTYFTELKQHGVPFKTRMQWLSRIYGGRGGYTSEELHEIVTGKPRTGPYYIYPFVRGAPPEVNRILERTYRRHRAELASRVAAGKITEQQSKVASGIAAWNKVKQAGYVRVSKPMSVWVKKKGANMVAYTPTKRYTIGPAVGKLAEQGVRGLWRGVRRYPRLSAAGGGFVVGGLMQKRRRKSKYQLHVRPLPPLAAPTTAKTVLVRGLKLGQALGTRAGLAAWRGAQTMLVALGAAKLLELLARKAPYMPEIRPDIELQRGYKVFDGVVQYAAVLPSKTLLTLQRQAQEALRKTKVGVERGLLAWLLGYISAELMARGITRPKRQHEIILPAAKSYARPRGPRFTITETGERLPRWGFQPFIPGPTREPPIPASVLRRVKLQRAVRLAPLVALPPLAVLLARRLSKREEYTKKPSPVWLLALLRRRKQKQEEYSVIPVLGSVVKKVAKAFATRPLEKATNVAMITAIAHELWPRKRKLPKPPVRYRAACLKKKRKTVYGEVVEMYPFRSEAQRRWMHATHPKMAEEWEEETPKGKGLPERVKKHARRQEYAVSSLLRAVPRLAQSRMLGRHLAVWSRAVAAKMRGMAATAVPGEKITALGATAPAATWFKQMAGQWDTVADQAEDLIKRGRLEKLGILAAGTAAGAAAHEVGKQRERERVRKLVG